MKKTLLFLTFAALMTSGCSKTWSGIKQDTHELFVDTKEVIHEATAPSQPTVVAPIVHNNVAPVQESTITPIEQGTTVQVFEDTPTVTK
jgi:uncharacterized protein YcfL